MANNKPKAIAQPARWTRRSILAGLSSGLLAAAAFPMTRIWPLALTAYVPLLLWLVRDKPTPRQAACAGGLAGLVLHAVIYWFLAFTTQHMSDFPFPLAALTVIGYAAAMGLHQALFAWLAQLALSRPAESSTKLVLQCLGLGALYAVTEFAVPALFPWHLGNALYTTAWWIQPADLLGIAGVSWLCMTSNALLAMLWLRPNRAEKLRIAAAWGVLLLLWGGYGAWRLQDVLASPVRKHLHATVVQADATVAEKLAQGRARMPMLDRHIQDTLKADLRQTDLVVWPEGALPFFWVVDAVGPGAEAERNLKTAAPPILREMKQKTLETVQKIGKPLLTGSLRRLDRTWQQEARNAAFLLQPDGKQWVYDKKILLPFGEYLPGDDLFPSLREVVPGVSHMDAGTTSGLIEVAGVQLLVNICYEALYPRFLLDQGPKAEVLLNLTNDIWFGPPPAPDLHLMVQQARAVELRRPLLRSTITGISALVDAGGQIQQPTGFHERVVRQFDVEIRDITSPYRVWRDGPMWLLTLAVAAWAVLAIRRKNRQTQ